MCFLCIALALTVVGKNERTYCMHISDFQVSESRHVSWKISIRSYFQSLASVVLSDVLAGYDTSL